jgi:hypothetical protein
VFSGNEDSLAIFLRNMRRFDQYFCELMATKVDFTLKMEVHGNKGEMIHCRVSPDSFDRPEKADYRIQRKRA